MLTCACGGTAKKPVDIAALVERRRNSPSGWSSSDEDEESSADEGPEDPATAEVRAHLLKQMLGAAAADDMPGAGDGATVSEVAQVPINMRDTAAR
jgi:hypothetical protein